MNKAEKRQHASHLLCCISIIAFSLWALLPMFQTLTRSYGAAAAILLFAVGILLDTPNLKRFWKKWLLRGLAIAILVLAYVFVLDRGGDNKKSALVLCVFFWFPVFFYSRSSDVSKEESHKPLGILLLIALTLSSLITTGWNLSAVLNKEMYSGVTSLSRAVSSGYNTVETTMGMHFLGINGYGYIYALVFAMPFFWIAAERQRGWKKLLAILFIALQVVTVILSQFIYAICLTAAILMIEIIGLLARKISKDRLSLGVSLLIGLVPLLLAAIFFRPLTELICSTLERLGSENLNEHTELLRSAANGGLWNTFRDAYNEMLLNPPADTLPDGSWNDLGRVRLYMKSLVGFTQSPLTGSLFGGTVRNGLHSDILDSLSTCGLLGTAVLGFLSFWAVRPCAKGQKGNPYRAHIILGLVAAIIMALINPICVYPQISLLLILGIDYALKAGRKLQAQ